MVSTPYLFFNGDVPLAARVHRNTDDPFARQPAVIVSGSWLAVKEQMADLYASALAERGYTVFTFDFTGFGESGGGARQAEIPARKIADITAAANYVRNLSFVEPGKLGYLAVCASAQYALAAIAAGAPITSFASVAGWFHDTESVAPFYGGADGVALRYGRAREAFDEYIANGEVRTVPAYEDGNDRAGMFFELDYYANPERGVVPAWKNEMAEFSWLYWLTFDGLRAAPNVEVPTVIIHSDDAVLPDNARKVYDDLAGPKQLVWSEGQQIDFYDQPKQVAQAVDAADKHFRSSL